MKKVLFLLLFSSAFADRASADGLAATCGISPASVITDGQFQSAVGSCAGYLLGTQILIDGPAGIEILWGMGKIDDVHAFYLNDKGEVVLSYEETGDRTTIVAAYTGPGVVDIGKGGTGGTYLPFATITSDSASLELNPGPVLSDPREPGGKEYWVSESILATGITNGGIVEGDEQYGYDYAFVSQQVTWNFQPVPEPATLLLLIPGLLALAVFRLKKATA